MKTPPLKQPGYKALTPGWYFSLLRRNWGITSQMLVASILVQLFALALPVFYIVIFDRVFGRHNLSTLDVIGIGVLVILVFDTLIKTLRTHMMAHQLEWLNKLTSGVYLDSLFGTTMADMGEETATPRAEQFSELTRLNQSVSVMLMMYMFDAAFSVLIVIVLFLLNPLLAAVSMLSLIPVTIIAFLRTPAVKKRAQSMMKGQQVCQYKIAEVLRSSETLQSLNASEHKKRQLKDQVDHFHEESLPVYLDQIGSGNLQGLFINLGSILTLYVGAHVVLTGEISYGVYLAINMLSRGVLGSLQKLIAVFAQNIDNMSVSPALQEAFSKPLEENEDGPAPIVLEKAEGALAFHNVSFRYGEDQHWVLKDLSFELKPGERVVITGKSGAGKTTLIRLMQRLYEPANGYITLDGYNVADMSRENLREHVAVALQKPSLFSGSVFDNIALARPDISKKEVVEALKLAQFEELVFDFPEGVETPIQHFGLNLSGGEVSRIAIARLFLGHHSVVVLDEALSNVPPAVGVAILNNIHKYFRNATCIFVSNFIPLHQSVDRILVLDDGHVVEEGKFRELADKKGYYHQLFDPNAKLSGSGASSPQG